MQPVASGLWRLFRAYQVYGANTNVGKTVVSTILCKALRKAYPEGFVGYLKPVSTGPQDEADDYHVTRFADGVSTKCLFQYAEAVSPHIAAGSKAPKDHAILQAVSAQLSHYSRAGRGVVLLETAGGVHSPTPSGSSQADFYRPLRLPIILVADHRLGGISSSISAFESLRIRGYDLESVVVFKDHIYRNFEYLGDFFEKHGIPTYSLALPPERSEDKRSDEEAMSEYYDALSDSETIQGFVSSSSARHIARVENLENMAGRAEKSIWYPFTQHQTMSPSSIITIDSAHGDFFQTLIPSNTDQTSIIRPSFDGSASWWTQGLGHANPSLSLAAAYAAGRYGHVMFAGAIHEPALSVAELLLEHLANPRLEKVFYSDDGSTGIEVALKMGLRASCQRYGWDDLQKDVGILGLKGSYHGDTIGAMDCSEPSTYNEKVGWYSGRGHWLDFPQVKMINGSWTVTPPPGMEDTLGPTETFPSLAAVFDIGEREKSASSLRYRENIKKTLQQLIEVEGKAFGALVMEPVILGAGGMLLADPLFQRCLVQVIRENPTLFGPSSSDQHASVEDRSTGVQQKDWSGLPIIFDEVFTGLYRLGRFSSASFLGVQPDISVHAKLLTGGLVPLCVTLASRSIYNSFLSPDKTDALLHGHSYTAHAVGCKVAQTAVNEMLTLDQGNAWDVYKQDWIESSDQGRGMPFAAPKLPIVWSTWSKGFVTKMSHHKDVESVIALGTVLAINLRDTKAGYTSTAANSLQQKLLHDSDTHSIHSRVLGNVLYLMASQTTEPRMMRALEDRVFLSMY